MRKKYVSKRSSLKRNDTKIGYSIEQEIRKKMEGEEIEMGQKPTIYTKREEGVIPIYNIRTDKWEVAQEAMDAVEGSRRARAKKAMEKPTQEEIDALAVAQAKEANGDASAQT